MLKAQGGFWAGRPPSHTDDGSIVFHPHLSVSARRTSGFHQRSSSLGGGGSSSPSGGASSAGAGDGAGDENSGRRYGAIAPLKLALGAGGPPALNRVRQTDFVDV